MEQLPIVDEHGEIVKPMPKDEHKPKAKALGPRIWAGAAAILAVILLFALEVEDVPDETSAD